MSTGAIIQQALSRIHLTLIEETSRPKLLGFAACCAVVGTTASLAWQQSRCRRRVLKRGIIIIGNLQNADAPPPGVTDVNVDRTSALGNPFLMGPLYGAAMHEIEELRCAACDAYKQRARASDATRQSESCVGAMY